MFGTPKAFPIRKAYKTYSLHVITETSQFDFKLAMRSHRYMVEDFRCQHDMEAASKSL